MAVALIYAQAGGGKTVNTTLVKGEKNILLNSDNSALVLRNFDRPNLTIERIEHWCEEDNKGIKQNCLKLQFRKAVEDGYSNIIIDNVSDIFDLAILEYDENARYKDMRQAYQKVYQDLKRLVREATQVGCNVIFTAWSELVEVPTDNGEMIVRKQPKIPGKILDNFLGLCNVVGVVKSSLRDKDDPKSERVWYYGLQGSENIYAKDQLYCRKSCMPADLFEVEANNG